ncbi:DNA-processing protein DprA [Pseudomonas endophytica]|uniref:DNA-processing protein DprA n=1 Tax=Pseudomonas endophytica TaxID=1563157 RepID=UPI0009EB4F33|nr:DNA-processing protein DprA [Pseudomonas endophytica]
MENTNYWRHERIAFLSLCALKGIGFRTLYKIAQSEISFNEALRSPQDVGLDKIFRDANINSLEDKQALWAKGLVEARALANINVTLIFKHEDHFPQKLANIPDSPEWIFIQGNVENLYLPAMSIVGTRKPSADGIFLTRFLVAALTNQKCVTVSGLALGIDQTAHVESIRYGIPTIAVLGTGILENYPRGSEGLRSEIINKGGSVISEYLPHQSYSAENFVRRNRLQAALGDILFPTEWEIKSGTAHTVKFASKYGKKIINLHLPSTYIKKPELAYAETAYEALSLEIPKDTQLLIGLVSYFTDSDQTHTTLPPEHVVMQALDEPAPEPETKTISKENFDQLTLLDELKDPQLSLL